MHTEIRSAFSGWQSQPLQQHHDGEGAGGTAAGTGGAGEGGTGAGAAGTGGGAGGDGGADGGAGETGAGAAGAADTFVAPRDQAEFDRMTAARITRERAKFADYDDLKSKAAKLDEIEAAGRTELENEKAAREAAEQTAAAATAKANATLRKASVMAAASTLKAADPEATFVVLEGIKKYADMVTVDDDGEVTGADEAIKSLLKDKPYLVGTTSGPGSADGGSRQDGGAEKPKTLGDAVAQGLQKQSG